MKTKTEVEPRRLVVVSNRLPVVVVEGSDGLEVRPGSGGLVTALAPVLRDRGGLWIGWAGNAGLAEEDGLLAAASEASGYELQPIGLTSEQIHLFYDGFCNEVVWPLFHDLVARCVFDPEYWRSYQEINRNYAELTAARTGPGDFIWVHDYHLMLMAGALRALGAGQRLGFFLHTPFPPPDIFLNLPWRAEILAALLEYDLLGFQTMRDRRSFLECVSHFWPELRTSGRGAVISLEYRHREVRIGSFPIGIDYREFSEHAETKVVKRGAEALHGEYPGQQMILGVDRLDYTKGIPLKLDAFRRTLRNHPELHRKITLVQIVVPSRCAVPQYQALKESIEGLVGQINGEFTEPGWVPIHYHYRSFSREELLTYYRACEVALVTPLKDGMNLVAKEFCASSPKEDAVLILSEFAGATAQFYRWAMVVNPNDVEAMAEAIHQAVLMPRGERKSRMRRLREVVKEHDIYDWVNRFLAAALSRKLADFPPVAEYRSPCPPGLVGATR